MKTTIYALAVVAGMTAVSAHAASVKLRFSTSALPTVNQALTIQDVAKDLAQATNGQMTLDVFLGGTLYSQDQETSALERGLIDLGFTGLPFIVSKAPKYDMLTSAYFFRDEKHMSEVLNGPIGQKIWDDIAQKTGIRVLSAWYFGERDVSYRNIGHDIRTPADMKGVKLRMPNSPSWMELGRALGANPTPISISELYLALSTGTVDAQDNPLPNSIKRKFYEVANHVTLTGHQIGANLVAINEKSWEALSPDQQKELTDALEKGRQDMLQRMRKDEGNARSFLESKGVSFIEPDKSVWIDYARRYYKDSGDMAKWDMDLYNRAQAVGE